MITDKEIKIEFEILRNNIRYYRKLNKLTQEQLAEKADLSTSYIKQIESEKDFKNISLIYLLKLAKALDIPLYLLCKEKDEL